MSVTHLMPVHLYQLCLKLGGTHRFEITADEMPGLGLHPNARFGVRLTCEEALPMSSGVWRKILQELCEASAITTYRGRDTRTYEVLCYVPVPAIRQRQDQPDEAGDSDLSEDQRQTSPRRLVNPSRRTGSRHR